MKLYGSVWENAGFGWKIRDILSGGMGNCCVSENSVLIRRLELHPGFNWNQEGFKATTGWVHNLWQSAHSLYVAQYIIQPSLNHYFTLLYI